jgi:uncharacterized membrane protein required for colicin V production
MMTISFAFWMLVFLFAVIGAMRGWAKELLVLFSVILALFLLSVMERYVPPIRDFLSPQKGPPDFWVRATIVSILAFFGYQTPNIPRLAGGHFAREKFSDALLGFFLGAVNGFMIFGTIWYFMDVSKYPFHNYIVAPDGKTPIGVAAQHLIQYLPPRWLGVPSVYFAVAVAFLFVLVVFI